MNKSSSGTMARQELDLTGWYLTDNKGITYTFPQLTLYPGVKSAVAYQRRAKIHPQTCTGAVPPRSGYPVNWRPCTIPNNIVRAFYRIVAMMIANR